MPKRFLLFCVLACASSLSGHATIKLSPQVRQKIREFAEQCLEKCYSDFADTLMTMYDESGEELPKEALLRKDIDNFCDVLSRGLPCVLTHILKKSLSSCNNQWTGLRAKVTCSRVLEHPSNFFDECLSALFIPKFSVFNNTGGFLRIWGNLGKANRSTLFLIESFERFLKGEKCSPKEREATLRELLEKGLITKTKVGANFEINIPGIFGSVFSDGLLDDVCMQCCAEALRQSSPKVKVYHRMFLFFGKDIPESEAALFYGEEVFRASLRYERIKRDVQNGTIDGKTHQLADRFEQLASEILRRRNVMACVAEADMKERHFKFLGVRPSNRLPGELKIKIGKETDFISRMTKKLEDMRNDLNVLQKNSGIVLGQAYWDNNRWKPNLVGEEEGKKILEEIE